MSKTQGDTEGAIKIAFAERLWPLDHRLFHASLPLDVAVPDYPKGVMHLTGERVPRDAGVPPSSSTTNRI
jgi:hypothetical protein